MEEISDLRKQYDHLQFNFKNKPQLRHELVNHNKILLNLQTLIENKLQVIGYKPLQTRSRRALFADLGTIVKLTTGNLDSVDGDRYNKILEDLNNKDQTLQKQIELQYSLTREAIAKFDNVIKNIEHNESALHFKISQLSNITDTAISIKDVFAAKDVYTQLIFHYNSVLAILRDLENALTFCKLKTYHPSILKLEDLKAQIEQIRQNRNINISPDDLNISELQQLIEVNCEIVNNKILFFLSFPINHNIKFELYYLLSLPTYQDHKYVTIIPTNKYFLKSRDVIKPLNGPCVLTTSYQCFQNNININIDTCEKQLLSNENIKQCEYVLLDIQDNFLEFIPEINQYIAVFPQKETLKIESHDSKEIKELQGVYLIEPVPNSKLYYRDNVINFQQRKILGKPTILDAKDIKVNVSHSKAKIRLFNMRLQDIGLNQIETLQVKVEDTVIWTIFNILSFILVLSFFIIQGVQKVKLFKEKNLQTEVIQVDSGSTPESSSSEPTPLYPNLTLPGHAKF